ncbi:MAG: aspartate-semialdehyde dehydrogenase [Bradyrhizobiaceae bacterium]|nr:aspartate-semialdehyde dehydrogenase [Bradyrhizobiaceae bacterium]
MNIAIVGATGLVGRTMIAVLQERKVDYDSLRLFASATSAGQTITVGEKDLVVETLTPESFAGIDVALFSAGGQVSKRFAPIAAAQGCVVIDNSSAFRMDPDVPLVVPEVNPNDALNHHNIIANPNCSTIQLVVALKPLHEHYTLRRVVVSTYQSISGAGQKGVDQLQTELAGKIPSTRISEHPLAFNTVFHGVAGDADAGQADETGMFTEEEQKMMRETRRIMNLPDLSIAATCVRIPVLGGHAESVAIECDKPLPSMAELRSLLAATPGVVVADDVMHQVFPTPVQVAGTDAVVIGRLRKDPSSKNGLLFWIAADNLRKGAATNAVQILELLQHQTTVQS